MIDDAIPEPILTDERSRRKTIEFCPEQNDGHRCMLAKGHPGGHECLAKAGHLRWHELTFDTARP
jgi:hypothetical protein